MLPNWGVFKRKQETYTLVLYDEAKKKKKEKTVEAVFRMNV